MDLGSRNCFSSFCSFASQNNVTLLTLPLLNSAHCLFDSSSNLELYQNVFQDSWLRESYSLAICLAEYGPDLSAETYSLSPRIHKFGIPQGRGWWPFKPGQFFIVFRFPHPWKSPWLPFLVSEWCRCRWQWCHFVCKARIPRTTSAFFSFFSSALAIYRWPKWCGVPTRIQLPGLSGPQWPEWHGLRPGARF